MSRLMRKLATVNQWSETDYDNQMNCLEYMFSATPFSDVYIPWREVTDEGMQDVEYIKIGYTKEELARVYKTYYGENFLVEAYTEDNNTYPYATAGHKMKLRVDGVILANMAKYKKLIELQGYEYNPLWNVDGSETFTYLENNGTNDVKTTLEKGVTYIEVPEGSGNWVAQYTSWTDSHTHTYTRTGDVEETDNARETHSDSHSVTTFDSVEPKLSYKDEGNSETAVFDGTDTAHKGTKTTTYNDREDSVTDTTTYGYHKDTDMTEITHKNAKNLNQSDQEEDYTATDVYGNAIKGGDKFHTEKRVREGNIGVTQTQELIRNERENLKFSIIMEFFKDLNEQVLVGIY